MKDYRTIHDILVEAYSRVRDTENDIPYDKMSDDAKKILDRDSHHLENFGGSIDEDEQYVNKNRYLMFNFVNEGSIGQSNIIALFQKFEDEGISSDDYGCLSYGGWAGRGMYFWYNPKNIQLVELIAKVEKKLEDYPVLDEDILSAIENYNVSNYWDSMSKEEQRDFCEYHNIKWSCDFYDVAEKLDRYVDSEIKYDALEDKELKKCASEFNLNIPFRYFH